MDYDNKRQTSLDFLPEAMVDEMIQKYNSSVLSNIQDYIVKVSEIKRKIRAILEDKGLLKGSGDIVQSRIDPTVCGVDGSYSISRQIAVDVVGIAAVAVEGLPPYEKRHWERPHHIVRVYPIEHKSNTPTLASGLMFSFELELASKAPHNVILIDGSLTTHLIKTGMTFSALDDDETPIKLNEEYKERARSTLESLKKVLRSERSDQIYAGIPKYSSRNEICKILADEDERLEQEFGITGYNDKALLSLILKPDEIVGPVKLKKDEKKEGKWHISGKDKIYECVGEDEGNKYIEDILDALNRLYVFYYKPTIAHPALRVEIPENVAKNEYRLAVVVKALQDQAKIPGILEPYPLYIADMFVKHLGGALAQIKEMTLSDLSEEKHIKINPIDVILAMHEYRSVGGYE